MTLRTLNYGNYGIFLIMGNAGFCPSTVVVFGHSWKKPRGDRYCSKGYYQRYQKSCCYSVWTLMIRIGLWGTLDYTYIGLIREHWC